MKLQLNLFTKNYLHLGPKKDTKNNYNIKKLYLLKDNSTVLDLRQTLASYKIVLSLITAISKNKGNIYISDKTTNASTFSNKNKIVSAAIFMEKKNKYNILACKKLGIPSIEITNNILPQRDYKATYTILANSSLFKARLFHKNLINFAIKRGKIEETLFFAKGKFPRLGSNQ